MYFIYNNFPPIFPLSKTNKGNIMKNTLLLLLLITTSAFSANFGLSKTIGKKVPFKYHMGNGPFKRSLQMNIHFPAVKNFFRTLDSTLKGRLNKKDSRTEAHITVITPPEFDNKLAAYVTIEEIHQIALNNRIQDSRFSVVCLGQGKAKINGRAESTYYLVVQSNKLNKVREQVRDLFISRGGNNRDFSAATFYPHITVGYTLSDLHLGPHRVKKDINSCVAGVKLY
jgi:2'-5' RNA ligase